MRTLLFVVAGGGALAAATAALVSTAGNSATWHPAVAVAVPALAVTALSSTPSHTPSPDLLGRIVRRWKP
jgi:hypothetical protein